MRSDLRLLLSTIKVFLFDFLVFIYCKIGTLKPDLESIMNFKYI